MSKFNKPPAPTQRGATTRQEHTPTAQGGFGLQRHERGEAYLLAASNLVGEHTHYESASQRDERFRQLIAGLAVSDYRWLVGMVRWLRHEAHLRSVGIDAAVSAIKARIDHGLYADTGDIAMAAMARADEPGEMLAAWRSRYGRPLPAPLFWALAQGCRALYTEYAATKYDSASADYRPADVIEVCRPEPVDEEQSLLFRYLLDQRHHGDGSPQGLALLTERKALQRLPTSERFEVLEREPERLRRAGMTWEQTASWLGCKLTASAWGALVPLMGMGALLKNLRNMEQAGVSGQTVEKVCERLSDPVGVQNSRVLPFQFLSAHRHTYSLNWARALETGLNHSMANIPALEGLTLVVVDRSGSMTFAHSAQTDLNFADTAALFGTALALRSQSATLVEFGHGSNEIDFSRGGSVLRLLERFTPNMGGTRLHPALELHYQGHDRVVVLTDEQHSDHVDPLEPVPGRVPVYTWNLAGYGTAQSFSGKNRYAFGGLSDAAFRAVSMIEQGHRQTWPWEVD